MRKLQTKEIAVAAIVINDLCDSFFLWEVKIVKDVYLFSGFLGSGKTSMLTDVIRQLKEKKLKASSDNE